MIYDAALRRADQAIGGVKPMTERRPVPSMNDVDVAVGTTEFLPASWEPKHEHKTAGVALMLHDWCETIQRPEA